MFQFKWFEVEVLQAMEKNVKLDVEYIEVSSGISSAAAALLCDSRCLFIGCLVDHFHDDITSPQTLRCLSGKSTSV